ncbi:MAG: hypothetical protein H0U77_11820 [Nocardioidaceae bacterium]|jgi:hypothetical protein|nr:hypothetical protein [Nocardioidaceae bacterium]
MGADDATRAVNRRHLSTSPFQAKAVPESVQYAVGDRVIHDAFGLGTVTVVEGPYAVQVDFHPRVERIPLPCKKMTPF